MATCGELKYVGNIKVEIMKIKISNFSLTDTLKTEQCPADLWYFDSFLGYWISYLPMEGKWYKVLLRQKSEDKIEIHSKPEISPVKLIENLNYIFWFDHNIDELCSTFSDDKYLQRIFNECKGLRVMRDLDKEYRILEAVLTQNTSVRMIKQMQRLLFINYGEKVKINGEEIYIYPSACKIASVDENSLRKKCKLGYRASYLKQIAKALVRGEISLEEIEKLSTKDARKHLIRFKGIGKKVADIILMYGFGRRNVFPMDIWVKEAIRREYFDKKDVSEKELYEFALSYFGQYASIINLMIFYKERKKKEFCNLCVWR